ncbi:phosphoribosylanthranilate isomerase [Desulfovibrio inopinatus]|uniref:phosphoribosylanthranilate isomerase n=1 Tax=Desulfovibrio inopinatus TaxID=102109 RepID=UPI00047FC4D9|nr:phosphoribosylanthranilate isomerase [Desulfovibrio inopinatus]
MSVVTIKVCGMTRPEDAAACVALGVNMLGFIFASKSPRNITPEHAASIETPGVLRVGVFVEQTVDDVLAIIDEAKLDIAQLHGGQDQAFCQAIGPERVMRVFWPMRYDSTAAFEAELAAYADSAHRFLCDAGSSGGGHGVSLDFSRLTNLQSPRPWLIAGGLGPNNVLDALTTTAAGVDINSGVEEAPGKKDHDKLRQTIERIRSRYE